MSEAPEECTGCGASGVELERVDLGACADAVYHMEQIQWWCPYCCVIPIQRREAMTPSFTIAAMMNELEQRLRAGTKEGGE